jgi:hypothetical protein
MTSVRLYVLARHAVLIIALGASINISTDILQNRTLVTGRMFFIRAFAGACMIQ